MEGSELPKSSKKSSSSGSMSMVAIGAGKGLDALRIYLFVSSNGLLYEVVINDSN